MSDSKIQVKVGSVEFSGEGNQDWLAEQLHKVLEQLPKLLKSNIDSPKASEKSDVTHIGDGSSSSLSLLNIAGKLNCKSGSDLVIAAAAFLHFTDGKTAFSRDELSSTIKKALGFYKENMMSNLTKTLTQLEKNGILNKSSNLYSIQAAKLTELNAILFK